MPKRIPISALKQFCNELGLNTAVLLAYDGERSHVVTWGQSLEQCDVAARTGNKIKQLLGWPDHLMDDPPRVKKLKEKIAELEEKIGQLEEQLVGCNLSESTKY
jgi:hypothetical protein